MRIQKSEWKYRSQKGNTEARIRIQRPELEYRGQNCNAEARTDSWGLEARIGKQKPALRC